MKSEHNKECQKQAYCQYVPSPGFENSVGGLRIMLPARDGYIFYHIIHTVKETANADIWRIGQAFAADDAREGEYEITPSRAEWDMALRLAGRDDFIGGYAHGDEILTAFSMRLDGRDVEVTTLGEAVAFGEITIRVSSVGYDPDDHTTPACRHDKEYVIDRDGITLHQRVEWLDSFTLGSSYMAMMPPKKSLTDSYETDAQDTPAPIPEGSFTVPHCTHAAVFGTGTCKLRFEMSVPRYPKLRGGDKFLVTDNGNGRYNKMYFVLCNGAEVSRGDIWETTTRYRITNG